MCWNSLDETPYQDDTRMSDQRMVLVERSTAVTPQASYLSKEMEGKPLG